MGALVGQEKAKRVQAPPQVLIHTTLLVLRCLQAHKTLRNLCF